VSVLRNGPIDNGNLAGHSLECPAGKCDLNNLAVAKNADCGVGLAANDLQLGDFGSETSTITRRSIMSRQSRWSRSSMSKRVLKWTAFLYLIWLVPSHASELPSDIWNGGHGGFPSVTANRSGISVTLPEEAIAAAGGGALDWLVKGFLDRWAPQMCTDLFDFQRPHPRLTVRVAVHGEAFSSRKYQEIVIDYQPSHAVNCVQPENLVW
jgi:hypothetical protein